MKSTIDNLVNSDSYQEFNSSFSIDDSEAAIHRARRIPGSDKWRKRVGGVLMILMVASTMYYIFDGPNRGLAIIAMFGIVLIFILVSRLLELSTDYQAQESETTDRDLIYYEFDSAIQNYQNEKFEKSYENMKRAGYLIGRRQKQEIPDRARRWFRIYSNALESAEDRQEAVSETFSQFAKKQLKILSMVKKVKSMK